MCERPESKYSSFEGHDSLLTTAKICQCDAEAAVDSLYTNGCGSVPVELHLQKQIVGGIFGLRAIVADPWSS